MMAQVVSCCGCGRPVGLRREDGTFECRHKGRTFHFPWGKVTCDDCGATTALLDNKAAVAVA